MKQNQMAIYQGSESKPGLMNLKEFAALEEARKKWAGARLILARIARTCIWCGKLIKRSEAYIDPNGPHPQVPFCINCAAGVIVPPIPSRK